MERARLWFCVSESLSERVVRVRVCVRAYECVRVHELWACMRARG